LRTKALNETPPSIRDCPKVRQRVELRLPLDPVDGQPLRYRRNSDGTYLLYSIGENGVDDGGNPSLEDNTDNSSAYWPNLHALDWVWPQPATPAEVQYFYDHPPK
jgi:hypothetical protein